MGLFFFFFPWWESSWCLFGKLSVFSSFANTNLPVSQSSKGARTGLKLSGSNPPVRGGERALIIPTCARLQWEGQDEAISCLSTGTTKSLYTSVSYFLFWHNQSSKLSRHDRIWQLPRTLAKLDKEESGETQRKGDELFFVFFSTQFLFGWYSSTACFLESFRVGQNSLASTKKSTCCRGSYINEAVCEWGQRGGFR